MKAVQLFSKEYLDNCKSMTKLQILQFLEDFRTLHGGSQQTGNSKLISMKVPQTLLQSFKAQCKLAGIPYQTQIKILMTEWLKRESE